MSDEIRLLGVYLHLARASAMRRRPHVRDRLLVVAGAAATRMGLARIADYCRREILSHNPRHAVGRWPTFGEAIEQADFLHLLKQIQRRYPQEKAERMLASLEIEMGRERDAYYSDEEYAAALLGATPQLLDELFGAGGK